MRGRKKLTCEYAMTQPHYQNIIWLIMDSQLRKKKITSEHLNFALVRNASNKYSKKEKEVFYNFFKYSNHEEWLKNGKMKRTNSMIDILVFITETLDENKKITQTSNLDNFLVRLEDDLHLIKKKTDGRKKPYYEISEKGVSYAKRYIIQTQVEDFLNYVTNTVMPFNKSSEMLLTFQKDIENSIRRIYPS